MFEVFEESANEYDLWFTRHEAAYRAELAAVRTFLPAAGRGLEIGVGTGRFAAPLGIKVGVEPARAMAGIAVTRGINVVRGEAAALPFAGGSFDFVLLVTVLCFLPDPCQALSEAARVLRRKGRLLLGMIDAASPLGRVYEANKKESKFYSQARFYPVAQVLAWLRSLGYGNLRTCQTIFQPVPSATALEPVKEGHGEGGFAVIAAERP